MVEVKELTKFYGPTLAVDSISFTVESGEIVGFLGPNGAGKTTTLRIITGFLPPTAGKVEVMGIPILEDTEEPKKHIGYLPENNPLYSNLLVSEYLDFISDIREIREKKDRIDYVAQSCGIEDVLKKPIGELSKGYKQRVGLASAIIHSPEILILDEPTTGLDPNQVVEIRNLIKELGKEKTVIISTHILQEVEATTNRVIIIHKGRIVADEGIDKLSSLSEEKEFVNIKVKNDGKDPVKVFEDLGIVSILKRYKEETDIMIESKRDIREEVFHRANAEGLVLLEVYRKRKSLEEIFRELTR